MDGSSHPVAGGLAAAIATATVLPVVVSVPLAPGLAALVAIVALVVAFLHAVLIALPAYHLLSQVWPLRWWNAALAGAVIGATPITLLLAMDSAVEALRMVTLLAPLGAVAGLAFRLAARPRRTDAGRSHEGYVDVEAPR